MSENRPLTPKEQAWLDDYKARYPDKVISPSDSPTNSTSEPTWGDWTKDLVGGTAEKLGGTVDAVNKYVAAPIIGGVSDLVSRAGTATGNETAHQIGEAGKNYVDTQLYGSNLEDQAKDYFKTDYDTPKKDITRALGKGIGEGVEWATGVKAFGAANQVLNGAKVISKTGTAIAAPWINKLNDFLQLGATGVTNTAAQFGLGRATEKVFEKEDDGELVSFTKSLGSLVFASSVVNTVEKGVVKAFKEASKILVDTGNYLKKPTPINFEKIKDVFSKEKILNLVKVPANGVRNKLYEKLVTSADAELDITAMQALEKAGIPVTPLVMFKNYERPLAIANALPNAIYRKYMENLEKSTLNTMENELTLQLGRYDKNITEDGVKRTLATEIDSSITKPSYKNLENEAKDEIKNLIHPPPPPQDPDMIGTATNYLDHIVGDSTSEIEKIGSKVNYEMQNFMAMEKATNQAMYQQADRLLDPMDYVSVEKVINVGESLRKEWDIAAASGTDYGIVRNVAQDIVKRLSVYENLLKENINGGSGMSPVANKLNPHELINIKKAINKHIEEGVHGKEVLSFLEVFGGVIKESIEDAIKAGTIKNKNALKVLNEADDNFANRYLKFYKMDIARAIQKDQNPGYVLSRMNDKKTIDDVGSILKETSQGEHLFKILKQHRLQHFLIDEINLNGKLSKDKMINLFDDPRKEDFLRNLMDDTSYSLLKSNLQTISEKLTRTEELLKNPLYSSKSIDVIMKKMQTRNGINDIFSVLNGLPNKQGEEGKIAIKQFLARQHFDTSNGKTNSLDPAILKEKFTDIASEDYAVGILGKKGFEDFKQKIEPIVDKLLDIKYNDYRKGGYVSSDATFLQSLKRIGKEVPYAIGGYELGGVKGAIAAVLGKEWIAKSFARAATDPTLTKRLVTLSKSKDDTKMMNFLEKIAKDIIYQMSNAPTLKKKVVDSAVEGVKVIDDMTTPAGEPKPYLAAGYYNPF